MAEPYDLIIVGAGLVGGLLATRLAGGGRILVLEAGEEGPTRADLVGAYVTAPRKTMGAPYQGREGDRLVPSPDTPDDYYVQPGPDKFKATYQRRYGGSTWHWRGNVPRMIPSDFRLRSLYGVGEDWPLAYEDLEPWYVQAEAELGVAGDHALWAGYLGAGRSEPYPMDRIWPAYGDTVLKPLLDGAVLEGREVKLMSTPQARNARPYDGHPPCAGNSTCDPICPIGAKYDATRHLDRARRAGVEIRAQAVVTRIHVNEAGRATGLTYRTWDGLDHEVAARVVVVAAHAVESARLLLLSRSARCPDGVGNRSGQVGRHLMDHLQGQGAALLPMPVYPFRGPPTTSGIDAFRDGPFRASSAAFRMSVGNDGWGLLQGPYATLDDLVTRQRLHGAGLRQALRDTITRQCRLSYSTETLPDPENRVLLSDEVDGLGLPRPLIHFRLADYNRRGFEMGRRVIQALFERLGATRILLPEDPYQYSAANHIMGTCRMGTDPATSVVDSFGRCHDHANLFVIGGSAFPTCATANPSLTIAALALRAVAVLRAELGTAPPAAVRAGAGA